MTAAPARAIRRRNWKPCQPTSGPVQAGYNNNFAYGTISLTANTYVQLVDQSHNSGGTGPEAVYAEGLILAAGATLDLNGLHLYVRGTQIASTAQILNGTVTQLPSGGPIEARHAYGRRPRFRGPSR